MRNKRNKMWERLLTRRGYKIIRKGVNSWGWDIIVAVKGTFEFPLTLGYCPRTGTSANFNIIKNIRANEKNLNILEKFFRKEYGREGEQDIVRLMFFDDNLDVLIEENPIANNYSLWEERVYFASGKRRRIPNFNNVLATYIT